IAGLDEVEQPTRLEQLVVLAGLRRVGALVQEGGSRMPITENILDHEIIGTAFKKGRRQGREEGRKNVLRDLIQKRFGKIPKWLDDRLAHASVNELDLLKDRVLDAQSLEDFRK